MGHQKNQTLILIGLIILPVIIIFGVYYIFRGQEQGPGYSVPDLEFRTSTGIGEVVISEIVFNLSDEPVAPEFDLDEVTGAVQLLEDGRVMLPGYPVSIYFDLEGNELDRLFLEMPGREIFEENGLDFDESSWLIHPGYLISFAGSREGDLIALFAKRESGNWFSPEIDPAKWMLLVKWNPQGEAEFVMDLVPYLVDYSWLAWRGENDNWNFGMWGISTSHGRIMVSNAKYVYILLEPGREPSVNLCFWHPGRRYWQFPVLLGNHIYVKGEDHIPIRFDLDGSIDWEWVRAINELAQPVEGDGCISDYTNGVRIGVRNDNTEVILTPSGVYELRSDGRISNLISEPRPICGSAIWLIEESQDGWLVFNTVANCATYRSVMYEYWLYDNDFNELSWNTFEDDILPNEELPYGVVEELEQDEIPLLEVGDTADLHLIFRDLHPVEGGYQGIDITRRRVVTVDDELVVTDIFDRTNPQDGLWQNIDVCRKDSRDYYYLLERDRNLIQVLDQDGNYVRRHVELGMRLSESFTAIKDLMIDRLDRLWAIGYKRIYVLDKDGNLVRVFESSSMPYRPEAEDMLPPGLPENSPQGYTILPSTGWIGGTAGTVSIVKLPTNRFAGLGFPEGDVTQPGLFYLEDWVTDLIFLFNWEGEDVATLDPSEFTSTDNGRIIIGPEGYLYILPGLGDEIIVTDPMLEEVARIDVDFFIPYFSSYGNQAYLQSPGMQADWITFIDSDNRLNILSGHAEVRLVFPLLETDSLEPLDENQLVEVISENFDSETAMIMVNNLDLGM